MKRGVRIVIIGVHFVIFGAIQGVLIGVYRVIFGYIARDNWSILREIRS